MRAHLKYDDYEKLALNYVRATMALQLIFRLKL